MAITADSRPAEASDDTRAPGSGASRPKGRDKLPDIPGTNLSPETFFGYSGELTPRNWEHSLIYIYRSWPVLLTQKPKYIEKVSRAIDENYILEVHGSGDYYFTLNDTDIKGTQQTVCQVPKMKPMRLRDDEKPPKLNIAQLDLNDPANASYVRKLVAEGKLTPSGEIPAPPQSADGELARTVRDALNLLLRDRMSNRPDPLESQAFARTLDMLGKANDQSINMVLNQVKQQDPNHFIQIIAAIKGLLPEGAANDRLLEKLIEENAEQRKENRELLMKLIEVRTDAPKAPSITDEIEKFRLLRDVFTEGGGSGGGKGGIATTLLENLPSLAPYIPSTIGMLFTGIGGLFGRGPQPPQQPGSARNAAPAGGPHPVDLGRPEIPAGSPPPPPSGNPDMPNPQQIDPLVQQLASFVPIIQATLLKYINEGRTGADFADWIADSFGEVNYGMMQRLTKDQILQALTLTPALAPLTQNMPEQLGQFIDEFLNPSLVAEEETPADAAPQAETKPKKARKGEPVQ